MSSALRCKHSNSKNFTCGGCSTQRNFMWRAIKIFGWVLSWWSVTSFAKQGTLPFECGTLSSLWSPTFFHLPLHLKGHQVIMYVWVDSVLAFQRDTDSESMNCFADGCQGDQSSSERNHLLVSDLNDQCGGSSEHIHCYSYCCCCCKSGFPFTASTAPGIVFFVDCQSATSASHQLSSSIELLLSCWSHNMFLSYKTWELSTK